jgi:hypothetical protein
MWRFALARARGTSHAHLEIPCQDRCACVVLPCGGIVAALADGAGSAQFAEDGAEIAVNEVIAAIAAAELGPTTAFADLARCAAVRARDAVLAHARDQNADPRQFASTLLAIVSTDHGGGAVQIGDGVIVVNQDEGDWDWVFWPQRGEYANTTRFLTDADALEHIQVDDFSRPLSDIALISDGLESLALHYASKSVHAPFYAGLFDPLIKSDGAGRHDALSAVLETFLGSPRVSARTDDDMSIVLATRRTSQPAP